MSARLGTWSSPPTPLYWLTGGLLAGQAMASAGAGPWCGWIALGSAAGLCVSAVPLGGRSGGPRRVPPVRHIELRRRGARLARLVAAALLAVAVGQWQVDRILRPSLPPD